MRYADLVEVYEQLTSTTKRLEKTHILSEFLKKVPETDFDHLLLLVQGRVFPAWDERVIGMASQSVVKAIILATGVPQEKLAVVWKKTGDLGETAKQLTTSKKQATLFSQELTTKKVFDNLRKLASMEGSGVVQNKLQLVAELLTSATPIEAQYIIRTVLEDLRVGLGEGTIRDAIVWAFLLKGVTTYDQKKNEFTIPDEKKEEYEQCCKAVEDAINLTNDFASVAKAAKHGIEKLGKITLNPKTPIKVMLYPKAKGIADAFDIVGKPAAFEYKYDGFRMQIHKKDGTIQIFTRRLDDVTKQFPEVAKLVETSVEGKDFILDGEAVGYDVKTGKYVSFQSVSQRIKRKYDIAEVAAKFPVELNLFDVVELNGKNLLNEPFQKRREILDKIVSVKAKKIRLAEQIITDSEEKAQKFYEQSLKAGNEGVMVKNVAGTYTPGARVGQGVKVKPVMETLEVVITGAEWGEGKRGQWLATFIIAVRDPDSGELKEVGRVGTGFKEKEEEIAEGEVASVTNVTFQYMTDLLKPHIIKTEGRVMTVHPNIVIEVNYEEIQASPTYSSGYALRFPRFVKLREDRGPDDINTLQDIEDLYKHQRGR